MRRTGVCSAAAAAFTTALLSGPTAGAQTTFTWTANAGGNASGSWGTAANWNGGAGPVAGGADNTANFGTLDVSANSTVTLDGDRTIGHLIFADANTGSAANWTLAPGSPAGTLTLATTAGSPTIAVNALGGGSTATVSAPIAGSQGFTKTGSGTFILSGAANAHTFTGDLVMNAGFFRLGAADQIPDDVTVVINGGEFITGTANNGRNDTFANLVINGSAGNGFQTGGPSNTVTVTGTITLNAGRFTVNSGTTTLSADRIVQNGGTVLYGTNTGNQRLVIGAGGLSLASGVTFDLGSGTGAAMNQGGGRIELGGDVDVAAVSGTVTLGGTVNAVGGAIDLTGGVRTFTVDNGSGGTDLNVLSVLGQVNGVGSTAGGIVKAGGGLMQLLARQPHNYTGPTTVNDGVLQVSAANLASGADPVSPTSALTLAGGGLVLVGNATAATSTTQTFGGAQLTLGAGGNSIALRPNGGGGTTLTLPDNWVRAAGASLFIDLSAAGTSTLASSPLAPVASPTSTTPVLGYAWVKDAGGVGFAYVNESVNVVRYAAAAARTASGNGPTLMLDPSTNYTFTLDSDLALAPSSVTTGNSLVLATPTGGAAATLDLGGKTLATTTGGLIVNSPAQINLNNGQLGADDAELLLHKTGGANIQLGANLRLSAGTGSVVIDGDGGGIVVVNNPNSTFSGGVRLNAGSFTVPTVSSLPAAATPTSGPFGTGTLTLNGGSIRATSGQHVRVDNPVTWAGDTTVPTSGTASNDKTLTFGGAVTIVGNTHTLNTASGDPVVFAGPIGDSGAGFGLIKAGTGVLTLSVANTYTGLTRVNAGTLLVNGSIAGPAEVRAGATLGGSGSVGGDASVAGAASRLSPGQTGTSPGILTITGGLTLASNATYAVDLGGTTPGDAATNYDQVRVGGAAALGGGPLSVSVVTGYTPQAGDVYFILSQGGADAPGAFAGLPEGTFVALGSTGLFAQVTYQADYNTATNLGTLGGGNDVALHNVVPEPASASLAAAAALASGLLRRRRRGNGLT